jgi:hypothetical protein
MAVGVVSLRGALLALVCAGLVGCSSETPAPVVYTPPPAKPPDRPKRVHRPAPTPTAAGAAAAETVAEPESQLPAAAQSPAEVPPPAGLPHAPSEYIEPPAR